MGTSNSPHVMTLVNSIIGVSILAMPFCYKQCGIILASLILILINLMTRLSCHYLLKSAIMTRRKNFEFLAFHAFGRSGKTAIELCIILLMIGTCIAFFVVMGDLGPAIISSLLNMEFSAALRPAVLIGLAVFVVLPLGMLRNVDSLSFICTLSFLFYLILVLKVFVESSDNLFSMFWVEEVNYWRPAGILQCLPIFSMALSCQSQLFEVYDSVTNATLDRMNLIIKYAVDLCTVLYIAVGIFGYIAYYKTSMTGNLLMSFSESLFSEIIKLLFVLSVAVTFPLVIFPCRASLHSLLFKKAHVPHYELVTGGGNHIPEAQFKCITLFIITISLIVGLLAPNIEIVLGLVGSTIGVVICLLFPPLLFIRISTKNTTEKILAQMMCMIGFFIMVMGTYANLYLSDSVANNDVQNWKAVDPLQALETKIDVNVPLNNPDVLNVVKPEAIEIKDLPKPQQEAKKPLPDLPKKLEQIQNDPAPVVKESKPVKEDKRIEPPIPLPPEVLKEPEKQPINKEIKPENEKPPAPPPPSSEIKKPIEEKPAQKVNPDPVPVAASNSEQKINSVEQPKEPPKNINQKNSLPALNKENAQLKADNLLPKTVEEVAKPAKVIEPVVKSEAEKPKDIDVQQQVSDFVKTKPPLPILMNSNAVPKKESAQEDKKPVQRDILEKPKSAVERDKRDVYATNATLMKENAAMVNLVNEIKNENEAAGFVKIIVDNANPNEVCENTEKQSDASVDTKPSRETQPKLQLDKDIVVEKSEQMKENLIMAPSKLSDPVLVLEQKLTNDELKANAANDIDQVKPMLRELKVVEVKEPDNNRKK
ncbi:putative sodium-coupled neutral amino acid transporter 10 [Planococcus citri]|uniref:putative sodium-coupled neutral amino acid transporter 10 n=1 Tax=Planococcus citri TaxID=170843 RepID=UPI0031F92CDF